MKQCRRTDKPEHEFIPKKIPWLNGTKAQATCSCGWVDGLPLQMMHIVYERFLHAHMNMVWNNAVAQALDKYGNKMAGEYFS